jgi:hypothetical protein
VLVSEHAIGIVEISHTASQARERAPSVAAWLRDQGVIAINESRDELWHPSEYVAGPRSAEVAPDEHKRLGGTNTGVDIVVERELYHPVENYEPPRCPRCRAAIDSYAHHDMIEPWLLGEEPVAACSTCGRKELIGDWDGRWTFYVGELAVVFNNWPPLTEPFVDELGQRLGPRWRLVVQHT